MTSTVSTPSLAIEESSELGVANASVAWWNDYVALTKPRIMMMILLTVGVAMLAATRINGTIVSWLVCLNTLIATGMIAASASTLNQWFERDRDALMPRTQKRPLPSGRLTSIEAAVFGWLLVIIGSVYLWFGANFHAMLCGRDVGNLLLGVYPDENVLVVEYCRRNFARRVAGHDRLDRCWGQSFRYKWMGLNCHRNPMAIPTLHGDCLAVSGSIRTSRVSHAYERGANWHCCGLARDHSGCFARSPFDLRSATDVCGHLDCCWLGCSLVFRPSGRITSIPERPQ